MRRRLLPLLLMLAAAAHSEVVDITEGTNLSLAVDPAGEFIVIDLLGGLWRLPVTGGGATPLLPAGSGAAQPRLDPNGGSVVFQRWQGGQWDIWKLTLAGGAVEPLTETAFDEREPEFSADGRQVVFAANGAGNFNLFALDLESRALTRLTDEPGDARFPSFDTDGTLVYASVSGSGSSVRRYTPGAGSEALLESARRLDAPSWRPGGGVLLVNERSEGRTSNLSLFIDADEPVWRRLTGSEDVFVGRVGWLSPEEYVYAADGALWRRGIGSQSRSRILIFAAVDVENVGAAPEAGPLDATGPHPVAGINGVIRHDATGRVAFSALGDLWLIEDDELSRLTDDPFVDAEPQFTPDGDWLVFASDRGGAMSLWRQRIDSGQRLQVTNGPGQAFSPRVSADGRFVAFLETRGNGRWDESELRLLDLSRPFESRTLARGLFDAGGLTWQGRYLRLSARDAAGGDAYPQVFETVAAELGAPAVSQPALEAVLETDEPPRWQPAAAEAPYVIQAGRLFDGIRGEYRYHIDIHIDGQRITDIVRRGLLPLPERVINMSESTVLPGLIDVHTHLGDVGGAEVGKRWLRFGITTVREVTPDWRVSLERAETWASGRAPGPRLIVSPAMLPADADLPAGSPIVVRESRRIFGGFAHSLAEHWARVGDTPRGLSPLLPSGNPPGLPPLAISTLGQSYGDIVGQIQASGAYFATGLGALDAVSQVQGLDRLNQTFERIMRGTGRIAIGSDAPAVAYGLGFHDELKRLADRGVAPDQILRYATAGGAIALGLSLQLGTLEPGRLADLVVIDGDPLQNLAALRRVEAVVVRGVWLDIDDLDEAR